MCLYPKVIVNPEFYRRRHQFRYISSCGNVVEQCPIGNFYYPLPYINGALIDPKTVDDYFAFNIDGECVPLYITVPCGKCLECAQSRQNEWKNRMILEAASHPTCPCFFFTLTYNDLNLPTDGVSRKHVSSFIKSLHDYFRHHNLPSFRSVVFSEYGSLHGRPHYHGVIFGFHTDDVLTVKKRIPNSSNFISKHYHGDFFIMRHAINHCWNKGFTYTVQVRDGKAFGYISKYVAKNIVCPIPSNVNPNFSIGSRKPGIGNLYINESNIHDILSSYPRISVSVYGNVHEFTIPSFVRKSLNIPRHRCINQRILRMYKRWCLMHVCIYNYINNRSFLSLPKNDRSLCLSSLYNGIPNDLLVWERLYDRISSQFQFLPPEYTNRLYSFDFFKDERVFIGDSNVYSIFQEYNRLTLKLLSYEFPLERYKKFLSTRSDLKFISDRYFNNYKLNHPEIYTPDEKESILLSSFHYAERIKDDQ